MSLAMLFPGQGSQYVGMGSDLFARRPDLLGEAADEILGWSLRDACLNGPEDILTRTDRAQPALYALGYALWDELAQDLPEPPYSAAGHSLGEYTAHAAAGTFEYSEGLHLVAARGLAMAEAAASHPGGMAALLGVDQEQAETIATARREEGGRLWVANINAPGQIVLAGSDRDIAWLVDNARSLGVRRAVPLNVAGAFHSPLVEPAAVGLAQALGSFEPSEAAFEVWSNVTARPVSAGEVKATLAAQITSPVRFSETLAGMESAGVKAMVHVGPGDVTAAMARRSTNHVDVITVSDLEGIAPAAEALARVLTMSEPSREA